eukprot:12429894-Karenia_brevis.AAC.1
MEELCDACHPSASNYFRVYVAAQHIRQTIAFQVEHPHLVVPKVVLHIVPSHTHPHAAINLR